MARSLFCACHRDHPWVHNLSWFWFDHGIRSICRTQIRTVGWSPPKKSSVFRAVKSCSEIDYRADSAMAWRLTVDPCLWVVTARGTRVPFKHPIGIHKLQQFWNPFVKEQSPSLSRPLSWQNWYPDIYTFGRNIWRPSFSLPRDAGINKSENTGKDVHPV